MASKPAASSLRATQTKEFLTDAQTKLREKRAGSIVKRAPVKFVVPTDLTPKVMQTFCPPSDTLRKDVFNGMWRIWYGKAGAAGVKWSKSRSWGSDGTDADCSLWLLQQAWRRHEQLRGQICHLVGLMPAATP